MAIYFKRQCQTPRQVLPLTIQKRSCFFFFLLSVDWRKKTCKTRDGQHLLLKAYLLRRRLTFYVGSLHTTEGMTTRLVTFVSHRKKGRCPRPDPFPLDKAAREGSVIESNMTCVHLAEPLQHVNRQLCSSWTALELFKL